MMYLNRLKVELKSDLSGQADVKFIEGVPAPAEREAGLKKLVGSLKEMLDGFVQAWAPTLNGTIIPDAPVSMKKTPGGYLLKDASGDGSEETLDDGLHLTSLNVKSEAMSSTMRTTFTASPRGLLMTEMEGTYSEPASAPPTAVSMKAGFAAVDGFELPSSLVVTVPNVASFHFAFSGCAVQKRSGAGTKP